MSTSIFRRLSAAVGVLALSAAASFVAVSPATAVTQTQPGNIDPSIARTLTIHKLALDAANGQLPGTGQEAKVPGAPLAGAEFTVAQVQGVDLTTAAGWADANTLTPKTAIPRATNPDDTFTAITNTNGMAVFSTLEIGLYLVTETKLPDGATNAVAPFLVTLPTPTGANGTPSNQWVYDVHAYPKNAVTDVTKRRVPALSGSVEARNPDLIRWEINSPVPTLAAGDSLETFRLIDTLPAALSYVDATSNPAAPTGVELSSVRVENAARIAQPFTAGTDYTLDTTTQDITLTFLPAGLTRLQALAGGNVTLTLLTRAVGLGDGGSIRNTATNQVNESSEQSFDSASVGTLTIGSLQIEGPTRTPLVGAVYQVFLTEADAIAGTNPISVGPDNSWTTGPNGRVEIPFLAAGNYWVKEITAPAGFQLPTPVQSLTTVVPGGSVIPPATPRNYVEFDHNQFPAFALPLTGGDGALWFTVGGTGLIAIALGTGVIAARRRATAALASA